MQADKGTKHKEMKKQMQAYFETLMRNMEHMLPRLPGKEMEEVSGIGTLKSSPQRLGENPNYPVGRNNHLQLSRPIRPPLQLFDVTTSPVTSLVTSGQ
jgi:hypothetical protein